MIMRIFAILVTLALSACAVSRPDSPNFLSAYAAPDYRQVLAKTKLVPDPHAGWTSVFGPVVPYNTPYSKAFYVVGARIDDGRATYRIQIAGLFPKRVYLGDVYSQGRKLKSKVLDRERTDCGYGCTTVETIAVPLNETEMEALAVEGITLKVIGRRDDLMVSIPASYFAAVLAFYRSRVGLQAS